jgi:hypothetical protein
MRRPLARNLLRTRNYAVLHDSTEYQRGLRPEGRHVPAAAGHGGKVLPLGRDSIT